MSSGHSQRILAIETASEACSVALFEDGAMIAADHRILGRGHAEELIPMIAALPDKGRADRILVSLGPGSFTGVRIGIAAARALGFAWESPVIGYPTLALVAAMAQAQHPVNATVCVNGGHGEWFVQNFASDGAPMNDLASLTPEQAATHNVQPLIAGGKADELAQLATPSPDAALNLLPDARHALLLAPAQLTQALAPIYGRAPDAKPQVATHPAA